MVEGRLQSGRFPNLLRELAGRGAVGLLEISDDAATRRLYIETGRVRSVTSSIEGEKIGQWLVSRGLLTQDQLAQELSHQPSKVRFGVHLVQQQLVDGIDLLRELEAMSIIIVSRLFFSTAYYRFSLKDEYFSPVTSVHLSVPALLMAATRTVDDVGKLESLLNKDASLWRAGDEVFRDPRVALTPHEGFLFSRVDGKATATNLIRIAPLKHEEVIRALATLVISGLVEMRGSSPADEPVESGSSVEVVDGEAQYTSGQEVERQSVIKLAQEMRFRDHYARLGVVTSASSERITNRYQELAKKYHPGRAREAHLYVLRRELTEISACLLDSYETLTNPERRAMYDQKLLESQPAVKPGDDLKSQGARRELVRANIERAKHLVRANDIGNAVQLLDQAVRLSPDPAALLLLGQLERKNKMWMQRALDHLNKAVELRPNLTEGWVELADYWASRNDAAQQRRCLEKILSYEPDNDDARLALKKIGRK